MTPMMRRRGEKAPLGLDRVEQRMRIQPPPLDLDSTGVRCRPPPQDHAGERMRIRPPLLNLRLPWNLYRTPRRRCHAPAFLPPWAALAGPCDAAHAPAVPAAPPPCAAAPVDPCDAAHAPAVPAAPPPCAATSAGRAAVPRAIPVIRCAGNGSSWGRQRSVPDG